MPELPEVETIKNQLLEKIKGKEINGVRLRDYHKRVKGSTKDILAKIKNVQRRAKLLVFELSNGFSFIIHLKLTGQLIYFSARKNPIPAKATHIIFTFTDGSQLFFNDARKFGFLKIMRTGKVEDFLDNLGPEPLEMTFSQFEKILQKKKKSKLKPVLLDPKVIAGIGNIYAQEICFKARVLPDRVIGSLVDLEVKKLYSATKTILRSAIKHKGTSFDAYYKTAEGKEGGYKPYIKVYHRKNCPDCKEKLKIIKQNSRSTYYCEKCQK